MVNHISRTCTKTISNTNNMFFSFYDTSKNPPEKTSISQFPFLPIMLNYEYYF